MRLTKTHREAFVRAVMNDVPKEDYDEQARKLIEVEVEKSLPLKIYAVFKDDKLRSYLRSETVWTPGVLHSHSIPGARDFVSSASLNQQLNELDKRKHAQRNRRDALYQKLWNAIDGCATLKQAQERLPEFVRYLPADSDSGTKNLPAVVSPVSDFVAAGWPKGSKKVAAKGRKS